MRGISSMIVLKTITKEDKDAPCNFFNLLLFICISIRYQHDLKINGS